MMKYKCLVLLFVFFVALECVLRLVLGFCDALLFEDNDAYEYIAAPNQNRYRMGAHIQINSYSQRCEEPDSTKVRVLGLGDSVLFGGTTTDQKDLASSIFSEETGMQMLNISAGSWGPDNCAAYLREKGVFGAKAMVLVCSSHDAYDRMSHVPVVGLYPNYPDKQYRWAIGELMDRYVLPRVSLYWKKTKRKLDPDETVVKQVENAAVQPKSSMEYPVNEGFDELKEIADSVGIPLYVYLHAEKGEVMCGEYNVMGNAIIVWLEKNKIRWMKGIDTGESVEMYRDGIHLNEKGQRHLAKCLEQLIEIK